MATVTAMVTAMPIRRKNGFNRRLLILLGASLGFAAAPAWSGDWKITPSIGVNETLTDNVDLSSRHKQSDQITDIAPGINIVGASDRAKLRFDYQMHNLLYAQDSSRNNTQNALNALGTLEALENWFFIEASGSISQENITAYRGGASYTGVNTNDSRNTTETSIYRLSPYFQGALGSFADYLLRYSLSTTRTDSIGAYDRDTRDLAAKLKGITTYAKLGWALDASAQRVEYGHGRDNEDDRLRGILTYHIDPQFRLLLIGGREENDYQSLDKKSHTIKGGGFEWYPTDRTQLSATRESRFFGNSNNINFTHRTAGTAWRYTESEDANVSNNQQSSAGLGTYFNLFDSLFSTAIPDPAARAAYVNSFLQSNGISPTAQLQGGYLTTGATLEHRRHLSFALLGARNTVTFAATRNETEDLNKGSALGSATGNNYVSLNNVRQRGASISWSHKLTGLSTLAGSVSRLESKGTGNSRLESDEKMYTVNFMTKLGPKTNAGIGIRRVVFDGTQEDYTENAMTGSLSHQF